MSSYFITTNYSNLNIPTKFLQIFFLVILNNLTSEKSKPRSSISFCLLKVGFKFILNRLKIHLFLHRKIAGNVMLSIKAFQIPSAITTT